MEFLKNGSYSGERALYHARDVVIEDATFFDGESPLKEGKNLSVSRSSFRWMYPVWYCEHVKISDSVFDEHTRAGFWYCHDTEVGGCRFDSPKNFRRSTGLRLTDTVFTAGPETLWYCEDVRMKNIDVTGDYFCMNCENVTASGLRLDGKYSFDGCRNLTLENAVLHTKDAFWNCENVTVRNSVILGEYIGWNSKNLTFEHCRIESKQGLCYIDGLKMVDCELPATDLCFEFCSGIDAELTTPVVSIKNPVSGKITLPSVGELILEDGLIDPEKTAIVFTDPSAH